MKHIFAYSELFTFHAMLFESNHVDSHMILQRRKAIPLQYKICYADFEDKEMGRIHAANTSPS